MLIITDYGTSIRRLIKLIRLLDKPGIGEKVWIEPVNYASAQELADRIMDIFEVSDSGSSSSSSSSTKSNSKSKSKRKSKRRKEEPAASEPGVFGGNDDSKISKIIADERTNSLIIVASETSYLRILELVKILDVPIAGEGTLHVHKLQHADAEELAKTLSNLSRRSGTSGRKGESGRSGDTNLFEGEMEISPDKATNSLVIVSSLRDYLSLKSVIDTLDTMQRQVFVEAVIMEVSLDKNRDVGIGVHGGNTAGSDDDMLLYGSSQPSTSANSFSQVLSVPALSGLAAGIVGPEIEEAEDIIGVSIPAFGVALHALQTNSDVNVLSTPNVLATDNVEATIQVGENVPVQQGYSGSSLLSGLSSSSSDSTTSALAGMSGLLSGYGAMSGLGSIGRQNVGITLKVTPQINDDNQVRLEIDLEISEVKSIDPVTGPTISQQNAVTTSVVADQQTIVIGGLITDNQVETTTKTPDPGRHPPHRDAVPQQEQPHEEAQPAHLPHAVHHPLLGGLQGDLQPQDGRAPGVHRALHGVRVLPLRSPPGLEPHQRGHRGNEQCHVSRGGGRGAAPDDRGGRGRRSLAEAGHRAPPREQDGVRRHGHHFG